MNIFHKTNTCWITPETAWSIALSPCAKVANIDGSNDIEGAGVASAFASFLAYP